MLAAESCCEKLGVRVSQEEILDLLIPRVRGEVPGGDTFSQSKQMQLILDCLVLSCLVLSCLVLSCLVLSCIRFIQDI